MLKVALGFRRVYKELGLGLGLSVGGNWKDKIPTVLYKTVSTLSVRGNLKDKAQPKPNPKPKTEKF